MTIRKRGQTIIYKTLHKRTNNNLQNTTQKGVSETVNLRRTDNTMTIRKNNDNKEKDKRTNNNRQNTTQKGVSETRGQTIIDKTLHRKVYQKPSI